ncbi:MAG: prolipoprotein diacylglyceryl transferase [Clostridia bacterium]|jgi:phosphatidylglycerol:prolipoprotein diacylglycerol transferase|nr:prolipoprotein diacylglyceryl transferase [Clostridia bacterium]
MPEIWFPNLGIKINELSNVLFKIGNFKIYYYGFFISIAFVLGVMLMLREVKRTKQDEETYLDFAFYAIVFSIIGARAYYVLFSLDEFSSIWDVINIRSGGLAIYGGVIAAVVTAVVYTKKKNINFFLLADTIIPYLALGQSIGRWGNFFNKEAFGSFTENLFAMRIMASRAAYVPASLKDKLIDVEGIKYLQVHPTFLYESVWNISLFILLVIYRSKFKKKNGEVFSLYLIGYGIGRFFIEGLRTDQLIIGSTGVPISQVVAILAIILGAIIFKLGGKNETSK